MQAENRQALAVSIIATAISGGAPLLIAHTVLGWLLLFSSVPLLLWGWWPKISHLAARRKKLKAEEQFRIVNQRQEDNISTEGRKTWREPCRAWDEFRFDAGRLIKTMDSFRYEKKPGNWQEIMVVQARGARFMAGALRDRHGMMAAKLIAPFEKIRPNASPWDFQSASILLREWLQDVDRFYREKKQRFNFE